MSDEIFLLTRPIRRRNVSPMQRDTLHRAALQAGGQAGLARKMGLDRRTVHNWFRRGIPEHRVIEVSRATGIPVWMLTDD